MADLVRQASEQQRTVSSSIEESGVRADEHAFENLEETRETFLEEATESPVTQLIEGIPTATPTTDVAAPLVKDAETVEVEKIMEEGLGALYATLPEDAKPKFKQKGEEAATEIAGMVRTLTLTVKRVLQLLRDWLLTIPNVNRFFLEQEAKIKTDTIVELVETRKQERLPRT